MEVPERIHELDALAGFMAFDSDLWITPRYERLHLLNVLAIQQRMSKLDRDIRDAVVYERRQENRQACAPPENYSVKSLLEELRKTVKDYDDAISSLAKMKKYGLPDQHTVTNLTDFGNAFARKSCFLAALYPRKDQIDVNSHLLSVATDSRTWLHKFIGRHEYLSRVFKEKQQEEDRKQYLTYTSKYSEKRVNDAEFGIVAACLCLVQLLPVLALTMVSNKTVRLVVIIVLIIIVSFLNALFANTVRATNFGAIAAYSAIVVVFISQTD